MFESLLDWLFGRQTKPKPPPPPPPTARATRGAWAIWTVDEPIPAHLLTNPNVRGLAVRASWAKLEPTAGRFDWAYLDNVFAAAEKAGKGVSLTVMPALVGKEIRRPAWLVGMGMQEFTPGVPIPWDAVYTDRWHRLIAALGARYAKRASLVSVKLTGVNYNGGEMALPNTDADVDRWRELGYSHGQIFDTAIGHFARWDAAFPTQEVILPVQNQGLPIVGPNPVFGIADYAIGAWPTRIAIASHGLHGGWHNEFVAGKAKAGIATGYQHRNAATRKDTPPSVQVAEFTATVRRGLDAGCRYQEIYQGDCGNPAMAPALVELNRRTAT